MSALPSSNLNCFKSYCLKSVSYFAALILLTGTVRCPPLVLEASPLVCHSHDDGKPSCCFRHDVCADLWQRSAPSTCGCSAGCSSTKEPPTMAPQTPEEACQSHVPHPQHQAEGASSFSKCRTWRWNCNSSGEACSHEHASPYYANGFSKHAGATCFSSVAFCLLLSYSIGATCSFCACLIGQSNPHPCLPYAVNALAACRILSKQHSTLVAPAEE